jgi:hypothetical protein
VEWVRGSSVLNMLLRRHRSALVNHDVLTTRQRYLRRSASSPNTERLVFRSEFTTPDSRPLAFAIGKTVYDRNKRTRKDLRN